MCQGTQGTGVGGMSRGMGGYRPPMGGAGLRQSSYQQPNPWGQGQSNPNAWAAFGPSRFGGDPMASMPRPGVQQTGGLNTVGPKPGMGPDMNPTMIRDPYRDFGTITAEPPGAKGQDPYGLTTGGNPMDRQSQPFMPGAPMNFQQFMSQFYGQR